MQFSLSGPEWPPCSSLGVCTSPRYLPAPLHRSKHPQMLFFSAKDHVLKCPVAVTMTTPRGREKGETAIYEKRKLGQSRSKTSTSSSSAQGAASVLAGQHHSLPTNWFVCYCVQTPPLGNNFLQQCHAADTVLKRIRYRPRTDPVINL